MGIRVEKDDDEEQEQKGEWVRYAVRKDIEMQAHIRMGEQDAYA